MQVNARGAVEINASCRPFDAALILRAARARTAPRHE